MQKKAIFTLSLCLTSAALVACGKDATSNLIVETPIPKVEASATSSLTPFDVRDGSVSTNNHESSKPSVANLPGSKAEAKATANAKGTTTHQEGKKQSSNVNSTKAPNSASSLAYKDGKYEAKSDSKKPHGNYAEIEVDIKAGKIANIAWKGEGLTTRGIEKLKKELITSQDVAKVDAVSGATSTTSYFKDLAANALKDAKN